MKTATPKTFESWMAAVDAACYRLAGLSIHDLEDCCFADWHDDGMSPVAAARKAIRRSKSQLDE